MVGEINYGILDPNAAAKAASGFQQGQANRLALEQEKQTQTANALALQQKQQAMADENAMRQAYAQSGGDANKLVESLKGVGLHQKAMEVQSQIASQQAAAKKSQIEDALKHLQVVGQVAGGVTDQASYDAAKQQLAEIYGPDSIANMPDQYDPTRVKQFVNQSLSAKEQLDQQWKDADLQQKQFQFDQTQNLEREKLAQTKALEGAKLSQAERHYQGTQALEREKMGEKAQGVQAAAKEQAAAKAQLPQATQSVDDTIKNVDELLKHPGFETSVGMGLGHLTQHIPGTPAADFNARLEQLQGGAFLQARQALKGGGAITDLEGMKAEKAMMRMRTAQSEEEFKTAAKEYKASLNKGLNILKQQAGQTQTNKVSLPSGWSVQEH